MPESSVPARELVELYKAYRAKNRLEYCKAIVSEKSHGDSQDKDDQETYRKFTASVNMSSTELLRYAKSDLGKKSGLSRGEAAKQGIVSGRDRPKQIARLLGKPFKQWSDSDFTIANRVISFNARMGGMKGKLTDENGQPTRKLMSLLIWGHDPRKEKALEWQPIELSVNPLLLEKGLYANEAVYQQWGDDYGAYLQLNNVDLSPYKRVIQIQASIPKIDLQNQLISKQAIIDGWSYYVHHGSVTVEHLGSLVRDGVDEQGRDKAKTIAKAAGYTWNELSGRTFYEIGRPIPNSFDPETLTFLAYIYAPGEKHINTKDIDPNSEPNLANWVWGTFQTNPPRPWKASIGGFTSQIQTIAMKNNDDIRGLHKDNMVVEAIQDWQWMDTTLTSTPVNHHLINPIKVVKDESDNRAN